MIPVALIDYGKSLIPNVMDGSAGVAISAVQLMAIATSYRGETNSETRTPYSKFANINVNMEGSKTATTKSMVVSSRDGMLLIYTPALITGLAAFGLGYGSGLSVANMFCIVHFLKRTLEVLFLHKYSGSTDLGTAGFIGFYYALVNLLVASVSNIDVSPETLTFGAGTFIGFET